MKKQKPQKEINKEIKQQIKEILENNYIEDSPDLILDLFVQQKQDLIKDFTTGKRCLGCGEPKESNLTDWCGKCLEEK